MVLAQALEWASYQAGDAHQGCEQGGDEQRGVDAFGTTRVDVARCLAVAI